MSKSSRIGFIVNSLALSLLGVGASQAALIDRGGGFYGTVSHVKAGIEPGGKVVLAGAAAIGDFCDLCGAVARR